MVNCDLFIIIKKRRLNELYFECALVVNSVEIDSLFNIKALTRLEVEGVPIFYKGKLIKTDKIPELL